MTVREEEYDLYSRDCVLAYCEVGSDGVQFGDNVDRFLNSCLSVCFKDVWKLDLWNVGLYRHGHHCHIKGTLHSYVMCPRSDAVCFFSY